MIYPIVAYGDPVLKKKSKEIDSQYPDLLKLIDDMYETMYAAGGIGLAAPQIGKSIRLFIADGTQLEALKDSEFKQVFINPLLLDENGEPWGYEEGCLSIPGFRDLVNRKPVVHIRYLDTQFQLHEETFEGIQARIIQHEYDHLEGVLFIDHLSVLRKQLLKGKLSNISKGKVEVDYKMRFPVRK